MPSCQIHVIHPGPPPFILSLYPLSHSPLSAPTALQEAETPHEEQLQDHGQLPPAAPQPEPEQPPLQHHGQLLAQPQPGPSGRAHAPQSPHQHPVAPGAVADKEKERPPSCCAAAGTLLQHKSPAALGKGVLSRRPENETVLHQFCCPAADAEQKPACSDLGPHRFLPQFCTFLFPLLVLYFPGGQDTRTRARS
ncbi:PREDICTED: IQ motif and SEC7 domain-containing protein 3-like [Bison bison bison]|uniref:IQ motif and SEC7 domain-containing protein 3-like n=1 Tax=Bison bison bison TaxID=43346 RepID=A0A6P3HW25_BISBB|nr:PREDICTED: IQ motif and SEC7 domain-containing protein 3-like [Bison bison bison]